MDKEETEWSRYGGRKLLFGLYLQSGMGIRQAVVQTSNFSKVNLCRKYHNIIYYNNITKDGETTKVIIIYKGQYPVAVRA